MLQVLAVFRPLVLLVLRLLALSIHAQYTRSKVPTPVCAPCRYFPAHCFAEKITDAPTSESWSRLLSVGATGALYLKYWQYFEIMYCDYSHYFEGLYCGYCLYYQVFRGSILRVLPVCVYSGFCPAHTPSTRSIWAFSTVDTPSTRSS